MVTRISLALVLFAACGDDGMTTVDAPPDPCAPEMQVTGEFVDWDSSAAMFHGIFGAKFTLRSDPTKTASTAPNGRFILCVPAEDGLIDVAPMTENDPYVPGTVVVNKAVIQSGAMLSYRSFRVSRAVDFGFDTTKAHVYVHVDGAARTATTSAAAAVQKHYENDSWVDGNTGNDIYLGNIDPAGGTTSLNVPNTSKGAGSIPIAATSFTWVTVLAK